MELETNWENLAVVGEFLMIIGGVFGVVHLSFEIPSEWLEAVDRNSVPDNFQKVNVRTRRNLEKVLPKGQLIITITCSKVIMVEETQISVVTQSWTGRY